MRLWNLHKSIFVTRLLVHGNWRPICCLHCSTFSSLFLYSDDICLNMSLICDVHGLAWWLVRETNWRKRGGFVQNEGCTVRDWLWATICLPGSTICVYEVLSSHFGLNPYLILFQKLPLPFRGSIQHWMAVQERYGVLMRRKWTSSSLLGGTLMKLPYEKASRGVLYDPTNRNRMNASASVGYVDICWKRINYSMISKSREGPRRAY